MFFCGAFSLETKFQIKERAGNSSELSGENDRPLQCSHFNHDKNDSLYDSEDMGILVTDIEHFVYHLKYRKNPGRIGLSKKENRMAIKDLWNQVLSYNNCTMEEIGGRCVQARHRWDEYEEQNFVKDPRYKIKPHTPIIA